MKRLKKERVSSFTSMLRESGLMTMVNTKGVLFFPVEAPEKVSQSETGVILMETRKDGYTALVKPGLILSISEKEEVPTVFFGYATTEYAVPFDVSEYHEITGDRGFLSVEELAEINETECLMLKKDSILSAFEMGAEIRISDR
jgi:hypothetical protein